MVTHYYKKVRNGFVTKFSTVYFNSSVDDSKFVCNLFFKFRSLPQFWIIFKYLRFCAKHLRFIRKRFFNSDYTSSVLFLKYCIFYNNDFEFILNSINNFKEFHDDLVSRLQFLFLIDKYTNLNIYLGDLSIWDDDEFDWLVFVFVQSNYHSITAVRYRASDFKISRLRWWEKVNPFFIFYYKGTFKSLNKNVGKLEFDFSRKFNFTQSEFKNWLSGKGPFFDNLGVNKRFLGSFQIQFNFSDFPVFVSHLSNFRYVHCFQPIFSEMYDLPFINPALRPGFTNYTEMHFMGLTKTLNFAGLYHLKAGEFDRFVFDRYLYDHARMMISLPYRYSVLAEAKYVVNFGSVVRSSYFFCYFNYFVNKIGVGAVELFTESSQIFKSPDFYFGRFNNYEISNYYFRSRYITQILMNFWGVLIYFQKYFKFVNFGFESPSWDCLIDTDTDFSYDWAYTYSGLFSLEDFDRITRRFLIEFSKFLYSKSKFELNIIFKFIEDLQFLVSNEVVGWNTSQFEYSNMLTEFETGYRDRFFDKFSVQNNFDSWFYESMEQFYDYELWLYYIFQVLNKFLDDI